MKTASANKARIPGTTPSVAAVRARVARFHRGVPSDDDANAGMRGCEGTGAHRGDCGRRAAAVSGSA